jgi:hypothetical protein
MPARASAVGDQRPKGYERRPSAGASPALTLLREDFLLRIGLSINLHESAE